MYGTLGLGLMLFCLRAMKPDVIWKHRPIWLAGARAAVRTDVAVETV